MQTALSMKTGGFVSAAQADYQSTQRLLPICPECKEPVHLRRRRIPNVISYFAHPELARPASADLCSLRVFGGWHEPYSSTGSWSTHGQLLKKFQLELVSYFVDQFRTGQNSLLQFLQNAIAQSSTLTESQTEVLQATAKLTDASTRRSLQKLALLQEAEIREIHLAYRIVIEHLLGKHAQTAAIGLLLCSSLVAFTAVQPPSAHRELAVGATSGDKSADFALLPDRVKTFVNRSRATLNKSSRQHRLVPLFAQILTLRLLLSWRHPSSLYNERFVFVSSKAKASFPRPSTENPVFGMVDQYLSRLTAPQASTAEELKARYHPHLLKKR